MRILLDRKIYRSNLTRNDVRILLSHLDDFNLRRAKVQELNPASGKWVTVSNEALGDKISEAEKDGLK